MSGQFRSLAMFCWMSTHRQINCKYSHWAHCRQFPASSLNVDLIMFHAIKFWTISLEIRQITTVHRIWMTHMEEAQTVYVTTESPQAQSANKMGGARQQLCWLLIFTFYVVTLGSLFASCGWPLAMTLQPTNFGTAHCWHLILLALHFVVS